MTFPRSYSALAAELGLEPWSPNKHNVIIHFSVTKFANKISHI